MNSSTDIVESELIDITKGFKALYNDFLLWLPKLLLAAIVVLVFILVARSVRKVARAAMARTSTEGHIDILVAQIAYIGVLAVGTVIALGLLEVNLAALFTGLGVAGFAIGFAMKDILGNFLSGIILLTQRPFTIGDNIIIDNIEGTVTNIRVRDTQIKTYDGRLVYIPNNALSTSNIINLTAYLERRADIEVGVAYGSDLAQATKVCLDAATKVKGALESPEPSVLITGFADSAITLQVRVWIDQKNYDYLRVTSEVRRALKEALDGAGIEIPFPIRTVYMQKPGENDLDAELEEISRT